MALTSELLGKILKYLKYNDVINICNIVSSNFCQSQTFWYVWLSEKFLLTLSNNMDYKALAAKAGVILTFMQNKNIVLSLKSFNYILLNITINHMHMIFDVVGSDIYSVQMLVDNSNLNHIYDVTDLTKNIIFNLIDGQNSDPNTDEYYIFKVRLTNVGKINYTTILKAVMMSTTYIKPDGKLQDIDFDVDIVRFVTYASEDDDFNVIVHRQLNNLKYDFYLRYFV